MIIITILKSEHELNRWIKYEEDLNAEKGEWGKPHVATLSFKALVNLRLCMESGTLMLDVAVRDLPELLHRCHKFSLRLFLKTEKNLKQGFTECSQNQRKLQSVI